MLRNEFHTKNAMQNKNLTLTLENLLSASRECQSLTPKSFQCDPHTQFELPESVVARTRKDASEIGISPEVLIMALLEVYHDADASVKLGLTHEMGTVVHPEGGEPLAV
jgi:hypothetical protein